MDSERKNMQHIYIFKSTHPMQARTSLPSQSHHLIHPAFMLLSPETLAFVRLHRQADVRRLALQAKPSPGLDLSAALTQIAGRQIADSKIPSWAACEAVLYPPHLSLEQCSSEVTARYKAGLVQGKSMTDLTGGMGVDFAFLAAGFEQATYVERQPHLCRLARHNFEALKLDHTEVINSQAETHLQAMESVDVIFVDPARRDAQGGKVAALSQCEPDVTQLEPLLRTKARQVLIKLSPMLDLTEAIQSLSSVHEVHIVSVNNECKEMLLMLRPEPAPASPLIHCINLSGETTHLFSFTQAEEKATPCPLANHLLTYLYEPNASLLKAGAHKLIAHRLGVQKLHPHSHLYTSTQFVPRFPGRSFRIVDCCGFAKKELKALLGSLTKANLSIRNFPSSVAELRKRLGNLPEGGNDYLFATTLADEQRVLIRAVKCRPPVDESEMTD